MINYINTNIKNFHAEIAKTNWLFGHTATTKWSWRFVLDPNFIAGVLFEFYFAQILIGNNHFACFKSI